MTGVKKCEHAHCSDGEAAEIYERHGKAVRGGKKGGLKKALNVREVEKLESGEEEIDSENSSLCANSELSNISEDSLRSDLSDDAAAKHKVTSHVTNTFHLT